MTSTIVTLAQRSALLGPLFKLALFDGKRLMDNIKQAAVYRGVIQQGAELDARIRHALQEGLAQHRWGRSLRWFFNTLTHPMVGGLSIMVLLFGTMLWPTKLMGLAVWALLGWVLLCWVVTGKLIWQRMTMVDLWVRLFFATALIATCFSSYIGTSWVGFTKLLTLLMGYVVFRTFWESVLVKDSWATLEVPLQGLRRGASAGADMMVAKPDTKEHMYKYVTAVEGCSSQVDAPIKRLCVSPALIEHKWVAGSFIVLLSLGLIQTAAAWLQTTGQVLPLATWQDPNLDASLKLTRVYGTLYGLNPNLLAGFLIPCLGAIWAFGAAWVARAVERTQKEHSLRKPMVVRGIVLLLLSLPVLWAVVATGSRGGWLGLGAMVGLWGALKGHLFFHEHSLKRWSALKWLWVVGIVVGVVGLVGAISMSEGIQHRLLSMLDPWSDSSIAYRFHVYEAVWRMIQDHWLTGIGPGNLTFVQVYGLYMTPGYTALGSYSVPMEIWVEQGIFGLLSFLVLFVVMGLRTLVLVDSDSQSVRLSDKALLAGVFVALAGMFAFGLFDTIWYRPAVSLLFWFLVAFFAVGSEMVLNPKKGLQ